MGWLTNWAVRRFFANLKDPLVWRQMLVLFVGPQIAAIILNVVQAVEAGTIPVVSTSRLGASAPPTGPDKQAAAQSEILKQLEALGIQLGMVLLRLAIEVAVAYVRSQTGALV